jgi:hypothetical protein
LGGDEGVPQGDRFGHSLMNETTRFGVLRILLERAVRFCLIVGTLFGLGSEFCPGLAQGSDAGLISSQIPKRHAIMRTFSGDLNLDGWPDVLVLLRSWDEVTNGDSLRPLLIFVRDSAGSLRRVARADHVIACRNCGGLAGDPWRRDHGHPAFVTIRHSVFNINEFAGSGWRGWTRTSFKYDPRDRRWSLLGCRNKVFRVDHDFREEDHVSNRNDFGRVWLEEFGNPRGCWSKN